VRIFHRALRIVSQALGGVVQGDGLGAPGGSSRGSSMPRLNSTHTAKGSSLKAAKSGQWWASFSKAGFKQGLTASMSLPGLVTRSRVSPITSCSVICAPNSRLATLATVLFLSACVPVDDMVAEVPMHTS
jgi:hypothetical protein